MINKIAASVEAAVGPIADGATIMVGGFGTAGIPNELLEGLMRVLHDGSARNLVVVNNNAGNGETGLASGDIELELVPQGNLAERIRAAGAGIGAFFSPTAYGTALARNPDGSERETREINGRMHVLEHPIHADLALIRAERGDRWGNLTYRKAARNFGPVMAMAARRTVASVHEVVELGQLDPEMVVTPGIFVSQVVQVPRVQTQGGGFKA